MWCVILKQIIWKGQHWDKWQNLSRSENDMVIMSISWFSQLNYGHFWKHHWRFLNLYFIKPPQSPILSIKPRKHVTRTCWSLFNNQMAWSIQRNDILQCSCPRESTHGFQPPSLTQCVHAPCLLTLNPKFTS